MSVTAKCLINAKYAASSTTTEYTAPGSTKTIIDKFTATNIEAGARTISVYLVPSGGAAGLTNLIIDAKSLAVDETYDFTSLQNQVLNAGDFIAVIAGTASSVVIRASGREVT